MLIKCSACGHSTKTCSGFNFQIVTRSITPEALMRLDEELSPNEADLMIKDTTLPQFSCNGCGRVYLLSMESDFLVILGERNDEKSPKKETAE